ncbi:fumarylacetoacetate hydrolase family protein [Pseudarthrobacter sp. J1763]|uniref:fumarylacetoacetate hydrolase family protein n=1 Tax=Pseudarthrobacter sp. J1763 TaxID=3420445 RepID=UPI003D2E0457
MASYLLSRASSRPDTRPVLTCALVPGVTMPGQLIGIGENYWPTPATPAENYNGGRALRRDPGRVPLIFGKFPGSLTTHGAPIILNPGLSGNVVCEGELAVVLGSVLKNAATEEEALAAVAGVTVANDVSARDLQAADVQSARGKSLDTFCPLGAGIVTLDSIPDLQSLAVTTRINGNVVQESSTASMVFTVAELVMFCSRFMTLYPGDVILTGTPWAEDESVLVLHPGDTVTVEIEHVGILTNPVTSFEP